MKRMAAIFTALVVMCSVLSACGSGAETPAVPAEAGTSDGSSETDASEEDQESVPGGDPIELEYWTWFPSSDQFAETIAAFESANPGIKVNMTVMESKAFQEKTPLALSTGENIDIIGVQPAAFATEVQDYLADLEPLMNEAAGSDWKNGYSENALAKGDALTGGNTKMLVLTNSGAVIGFYNVALLEELGAEVPATLDEYKAVADKLAEVYPDKYAGVYAGKEAWVTDEVMLTILGQKGDYYNKWRYEGASVDSEEFRAAINGLKKYFDEGIFSLDIMDFDYAGAQEEFITGNALVYYMGSWEAPLLSKQLREKNGIELEDVGAMALPVVDTGDTPTMRSYIDAGIGIVESSEKKEAAAKFVAFVTLQEGADLFGKQLTGTSSKNGFTVDESLFDSDSAKSGWDTLVDLLANGTADRNNVSGYSDIEGATVQSVINGDITADQAVADLQAEWTSGKY